MSHFENSIKNLLNTKDHKNTPSDNISPFLPPYISSAEIE
jgi:hypothetical protein